MRRHNRRALNEEKETNKIVFISSFVLIIAVLAFAITFIIYSNYLNKQTDIAEFKTQSITDLGKTNTTSEENLSQVSSSMGKTVNEVASENDKNNITNETTTNETSTNKIAINTSNMQKETVNEVKKENNIVANEATNVEEPKKEEKVTDPTFTKPVEGEIIGEFAKDNLVYSNTLQEWVTHSGIDIKADKTTIVKASAEGTVKSIKNDPRYGITVVIEHVNGFSSVYSNLLTAEFIKEGEQVKQGQTVGTVGNTATFEIADEPHLHFEILKDNENIDPSNYIK